MRSVCIVLSFLLHGGIAALALFFPFGGGEARIDLDRPVYEVELFRLPQKKTPPKPQTTTKQSAKPKSTPRARQPESVKVAARQPAKASQPKAVKIPDKQPRGPKKAKEVKKKRAAPEKELRKKQDKPKSSPTVPTKEEVLAEALAEAQNVAKESEQQDRDVLSRALAALRQEVDRNGTAGRAGSASGGITVTDIYAKIVEERIKEHWRFPNLGGPQDLQAEVELRIDVQGRIADSSLVRRSGRSDFDRSVLRAVDETGRLPPPPHQDIKIIRITFNLQEKHG